MSGKYDDIIHLPHPTSSRHPRMSMADRAAQFSPFAALTGHGAAISETARLTDRQIELSEDAKARYLCPLSGAGGRQPDRPGYSTGARDPCAGGVRGVIPGYRRNTGLQAALRLLGPAAERICIKPEFCRSQ